MHRTDHLLHVGEGGSGSLGPAVATVWGRAHVIQAHGVLAEEGTVRKGLDPQKGTAEPHPKRIGNKAFPIVKGPTQDVRKGRLPSVLVSPSRKGPRSRYPESLPQATHLRPGTVRLEKHCLLVAAPEGTVSHLEPAILFPPPSPLSVG